MLELIERFPAQLEEALSIGESATLTDPENTLLNVVVSGLGGSGIGGSIVAQLTAQEARLPILVNKEYSLPAFVNKSSLVIISSYSGNTEETITALKEAVARKSKIVCITSGGKVAELAEEHALDVVLIPPGMPPRACIGYSLVQLFFILKRFKIIESDFKSSFRNAIELLTNSQEDIKRTAKELAGQLHNKVPVIYSSASFEAVAIRTRQQLNENAKMLCWHHALPEMNHNELVGWREKNENLAVLLLRNKSDFERTQVRMEISKEVFYKYAGAVIEIFSKGNSNIENTIYFINLGDWLSYFLAQKRGFDAMEIKVIDHLKSELSKI